MRGQALVTDSEVSGRPTTLAWSRRRMVCGNCGSGFLDQLGRHFASHGVETGLALNNLGGDGRGLSLCIKDPDGSGIAVKAPPTIPYDPEVGYVP